MAPNQNHFYSIGSQALKPIKTQANSIYQPALPTSESAFPILAIAVLCIMTTALLLVSYYIVVTKCCSNWHQANLLRWFSTLRARESEDPFIALSPSMWNRGLDESVIREIPMFPFRREGEPRGVCCVVCLNEFQEEDMLRVLPKCSHAFHLDCIDIWLQSNANCPLCRSSISGTNRYRINHIIAPSSSPQNSQLLSSSIMSSDEDFVVIELGGEDEVALPQRQQEGNDSLEVPAQPRNNSPRKLEKKPGNLKPSKFHHVSIMGDECIDTRKKDDQFSIQPIRRSFSMDSAADQQLYLTVQEITLRNRDHSHEDGTSEAYDSRGRRSFFPFRHGRGSRKAILPIESEL
ncbi:RING-H2 finger protein ATL16-like [Juglans microcarpa x Juglans regia]|uniref:RING-H2 finger protein ATL16-like n=1 Tax=Juglans microcarpa x Juglans regia TaxID=2249226 RepID=UPI001B7E5CB3|nr:RING-H2 finger protein ATL16-like [Juglans microcarpa x Juglans regia]